MNPYYHFVSDFSAVVEKGKTMSLGGLPPAKRPTLGVNAPKALFFSPHPDDECISGGLAVRVMREAGMNVINVAVTQGSKKERQAERLEELKAACEYLGFGIEVTGPHGLDKVNAGTRNEGQAHWAANVKVIRNLLEKHQPRVVFFPHEQDWNSTHIGTYLLVTDALKSMPSNFECYVIETEFWGQMATPNLMAELSETDLADMISATSFHVGEVKRNPYHLLLPAWTMDNVRRGTELVGGQGGAAPDFTFAALYRLRKWLNGELRYFFKGGRQISKGTNVSELFI